MDRAYFYSIMNGEGTLDYELYLNTKALLSCQKDFAALCNRGRAAVPDRSPGRGTLDEADQLHAAGYR